MYIKYIHYQTLDRKDKYYYNRPNGLDEYVLILAHTEAYFVSHETRYLLKNHQLFIYDKHQPQLFYSAGQDFLHDWMHFDLTPEERDQVIAYGIPFGVPITLSNSALFSDYIKMLSFVYNQNQPNSNAVISGLMNCFFMNLSDEVHFKEESPYIQTMHYHTLQQVRNNIRNFPYRNWTLEEVAKGCHMSKTWFQNLYRKYFGTTFQADLILFRVEYAKKILLQSDEKLDYIAMTVCGYNSTAHFIRQFKAITGFTPSQYRKQYNRKS